MASAAMMATYEKALERAKADGIVIIGRGIRKSDAAPVVFTSSATGEACHAVAIYPDRLSCDCLAGKRGQYCKHRAAVRANLLERAIVAVTAKAAKVAPVKPVPVREPVRGINDTRVFSLFK